MSLSILFIKKLFKFKLNFIQLLTLFNLFHRICCGKKFGILIKIIDIYSYRAVTKANKKKLK